MIQIIIIIVIAVVLVISGVLISLKLLLANELRKLTPLATQQLLDTLFVIQDGYANVYLIKNDSESYTAIDAGVSAEKIVSELAKLNIRPEAISTVFLTHSDHDHVGGITAFPNATIYLPANEQLMIDGSTTRSLFMKNSLTVKYSALNDHDLIQDSTISVQALATPGHTVGHTCYIVNGKWLFVGDCMSLQNGQAALFNKLFNMDNTRHIENINKIKELQGIEALFTAHYGYSQDLQTVFKNWTGEAEYAR